MTKVIVAVLALLLAFAACSPPNEDARTLASDITRSSNLQRHFTYRQFSTDAAYRIDGTIQDDFRYAMILSTNENIPILQEVINDDSLAVRFLRPAFASLVSKSFGHPTVDAALRAGKWVIDPAGAPALIDPNATVGGETTGNPFRDARDSLLYVTNASAQSAGVRKFSLEDVAYRPLFDPWRYPSDGELRYDIIRPPLPKSAGTNGTAQTVGPSQFRKLSVFVKHARVEETCEYVDIEGQEDIVALRQRGLNSNPYLRDLIKQIEMKQTSIPITPKIALLDINYPTDASLPAPKDAVTGKLDTFQSAFLQAFTSDVLRPSPSQTIPKSCNRPNAKYI